MFTVIHILNDVHLKSGGVSVSVSELMRNFSSSNDFKVFLISQLYKDYDTNYDIIKHTDILLKSNSYLSFLLGLKVRKCLDKLCSTKSINIIHNHGLWLPVNHWASSIARKSNVPLVIQTHGMLDHWAVSKLSIKKKLALFIYQNFDLKSANLFIATSNSEYINLRNFGIKQPIAIIPNGINLSYIKPKVELSKKKQFKTILFLSRIHPVKGLDNLIYAWNKVVQHGWSLIIAGPDESGYLKYVTNLIENLNLKDSIQLVGLVKGAYKEFLLENSDLFVLPSQSENFGIAVLEALAYGLPVITTKGTPWSDLMTYKCGWWVDYGVDPLVIALRDAMAMNDQDRLLMSINARKLAQQFDFELVSRNLENVYRWMLGDGDVIDNIFFN